MREVKPFGKYDTLGAYHWLWYKKNTFNYRTQVDEVLAYFVDRGSILDIGCGDGLTSFKLFEKGFNVLGIEAAENAVGFAREKCGAFVPKDRLDFKCMSVYDLDETGTYDYALLHDVLEHLEHPRRALDKIVRAIKKFCIITTPNADHFKPGAYDYKFWNVETIKELLKGLNYDIVDSGKIIHIKLYKNKPDNSKRKLASSINRSDSTRTDSRKKVLVTVPNNVEINKLVALKLLLIQQDTRYNLTIMLPTHTPYENNLHHIVSDFIAQGFDYWLSFDSDNPPIRNPLDLVELDKDIIGCPTPIWNFKNEDKKGERPVYWNCYDYVPEEDAYREHEPKSGLQEVDAIGTGCFLIARRVFLNQTMQKAPFERKLYENGQVNKGNDISFCERSRENGFKIFAHYDYPCQHFCNLELNEVVQAFKNLYQKV